jgi:single-stranded-DNA-specific exonuclease
MKYDAWKIKLDYPSDLIKGIIKERGIKDPETFLNPHYKNLSHSSELLNIGQATKKIKEVIKSNQNIGLFCDYDADGVCGGAIIYRAIKSLKGKIIEYVPKRAEGYGLSSIAVRFFIENGISLLITVDCGVKNFKEIKLLKEAGIDVIVIDHHIIDNEKPEAIIVHPALTKNKKNLELSGGGTAYMQARDLFGENGQEKWLIDLAAISSVADVVPLNNDNRIIVKYGLGVLGKTRNKGLKQLIKISGLENKDLNVYDLGFALAPRLNAAGRIAHPVDSFNLLAKDDADSKQISTRLNGLNEKRQDMLIEAIKSAEKKILAEKKEKENLIIVKGPWDEGIVGLIASKICEKYYRPAIVLSETKDLLKGSARSIEKVNITSIISKSETLLLSFGGHAQAAGLSLLPENYAKLSNLLSREAQKIDKKNFTRILKVDAVVEMEQINLKTAHELERLAPFGPGNSRPILALKRVRIEGYELIGKDQSHLKLHFETGGIKSCCLIFSFDARGFVPADDGFVDIAFSLSINEFRGNKKLDLIIEDVQESK